MDSEYLEQGVMSVPAQRVRFLNCCIQKYNTYALKNTLN